MKVIFINFNMEINKLYRGDCLEVMKQIPDWSIDAIITDPPYWTTDCKWDSVIPFEPMWEQLRRIIKPNGAIVLFGSEPFSSALRMSNIKMYKYDWVWEKTRPSWFVHSKNKPMKSHETLSVFSHWTTIHKWQSKNRMEYYPQGLIYEPYNNIRKPEKRASNVWFSLRKSHKEEFITEYKNYPRSVLKFPNNEVWLHNSQKPVALIEYLIKTYTNEWETVLDFTAWSFTTAVASDNTNRKWICIEQDEWYCKIWAKRINENRLKLWLDILDFTSILEK